MGLPVDEFGRAWIPKLDLRWLINGIGMMDGVRCDNWNQKQRASPAH